MQNAWIPTNRQIRRSRHRPSATGRRPRRRSGRAARRGDAYLVKSLVHATEILRAFQSPGETLRLRDVMERTRFTKGMCFRLLYTLHHCGLVEKVDDAPLSPDRRNPPPQALSHRLCRAGQQDSSFPREVHEGLLRAAEREQVELIVVDNRYQPKIALRNAEQLIREGIDLVIEFQTDEAIAPAIASRYHEAGMPMIAIDIPHPGATYFGANNYEAGLLAGRYLASGRSSSGTAKSTNCCWWRSRGRVRCRARGCAACSRA